MTQATIDAIVLIRMRVNYAAATPSAADALLLDAALHLEGRHALCPTATAAGVFERR